LNLQIKSNIFTGCAQNAIKIMGDENKKLIKQLTEKNSFTGCLNDVKFYEME
jgi:hypothetical protein